VFGVGTVTLDTTTVLHRHVPLIVPPYMLWVWLRTDEIHVVLHGESLNILICLLIWRMGASVRPLHGDPLNCMKV